MSAARQLLDRGPGCGCRVLHRRPARGRRTREPGCYLLRVLKLLLISVVFATFLLPALAASSRKPLNALRAMLISMLVVELAYAFFLRFMYWRFL